MATTQRYTMTFAGTVYQLGRLDAEQMATIRALIQHATFQPTGTPIPEDQRWIRIDGDAGPVLQLDRRVTTGAGKA
jgi:hypothetical protein